MSSQSLPMPEPKDTELRGLIPRSLMAQIDALAQVDGTGSRMDWVISVLQAECDRQVHRASLLLRMVGRNPSDSASVGKDSE